MGLAGTTSSSLLVVHKIAPEKRRMRVAMPNKENILSKSGLLTRGAFDHELKAIMRKPEVDYRTGQRATYKLFVPAFRYLFNFEGGGGV